MTRLTAVWITPQKRDALLAYARRMGLRVTMRSLVEAWIDRITKHEKKTNEKNPRNP